MKLIRKAGVTGEIWQLFLQDSTSTTGEGYIGAAFNTVGLTISYNRDTDAAPTPVTPVTMTPGTFTSSGFVEIDSSLLPGAYQFCPPNAALASGAKSVMFMIFGAANLAPLPIEVQLNAFDLDSATVTVGTNNDKTGYALTAAYDAAKTAAQPGDVMKVSSGTGANQISLASGLVTVGTNNDKTGYALSGASLLAIWDIATSALTTVGSIGKRLADDIDATISSRLASGSYTAPDNAGIAAIKVITDQITFSSGAVVSAITTAGAFAQGAADKVWATASRTLTAFAFSVDISAAAVTAIWSALTSALTVSGSIGKKLADWVLGSDSKVILSSDAQTGVTIPTVTTVTLLTQANTEVTAVPSSTASIISMIKWKFLLSRNKLTQTSSTQTVLANDGATPVATANVTDDGTTATRGVFT